MNLIVKNDATGEKDFSTIQEGDVVILPAFGASYEEMELFDKKVRLTFITCFYSIKRKREILEVEKSRIRDTERHGSYRHRYCCWNCHVPITSHRIAVPITSYHIFVALANEGRKHG